MYKKQTVIGGVHRPKAGEEGSWKRKTKPKDELMRAIRASFYGIFLTSYYVSKEDSSLRSPDYPCNPIDLKKELDSYLFVFSL